MRGRLFACMSEIWRIFVGANRDLLLAIQALYKCFEVAIAFSLGFVIFLLNIPLGFIGMVLFFPLGFIKNYYICHRNHIIERVCT